MYCKVMFTSSAWGATAGLVVDTDRVNPSDVAAVSRLFPATEFRKMRRYWRSPEFATRDEAFAYVFPCDACGKPQQDQAAVDFIG